MTTVGKQYHHHAYKIPTAEPEHMLMLYIHESFLMKKISRSSTPGGSLERCHVVSFIHP
jgi:hypothetical protein